MRAGVAKTTAEAIPDVRKFRTMRCVTLVPTQSSFLSCPWAREWNAMTASYVVPTIPWQVGEQNAHSLRPIKELHPVNTFTPFVIELEPRPEYTPAMQVIFDRMMAYLAEQLQPQEETV